MDLVSTCKEKLAHFRIKDLKAVLTELGLAKQGKKQDLVDRILSLLSDGKASIWSKKNSIGIDGVAKVIDDTYRKMQCPGDIESTSKSKRNSYLNHVKSKEEPVDSYQLEMKFRCLCGSLSHNESIIQCKGCAVWQHIGCVIIPDEPLNGVLPEVPPCFYCEICRIDRADPFWSKLAHPLLPTKLDSSGFISDGANTVQCMEKTYPLSRAHKEMLQTTEYDLQVWCILLNDKVPFRMQWPQYADLQVNGVPVRTTNRPGQQLLGINGRDDGPLITTCSREGSNKIRLSWRDTRIFSFGIRIASRRSVQQVLSMIPKEADGETFDNALARVCRCIGGGNTKDNADSDSELEVVADSVTVNLRCPMSGSRIKTAGRFKPCVHTGCFDLDTFVELNQRSRKWQCPICLRNYSLEDIIIDPYFNRITSLMRHCGEDANEIDVKPDGSWRAKNIGDCADLLSWHLPDGSLCAAADAEVKAELKISKELKSEDISEGHSGLKVGLKKNHKGLWVVTKPEHMSHPSSRNHVPEAFGNHCQNGIPMRSSPTTSFGDGEVPSNNQEGGGNFDIFVKDVKEFDSLSWNFDSTHIAVDGNRPAPLKDLAIIILSDSDEENVPTFPDRIIYDTASTGGTRIPFTANSPGLAEPNSEDPAFRANGTSCHGSFSNDGDDLGNSIWPLQTLQTFSQAGPNFQLFDRDADEPNALGDVERNSLPVNGYGLASNGSLGETSRSHDLSTCISDTVVNGSLVDNPLAYSNSDPSLQIFLPNQPAGVPQQPQPDQNGHVKMTNGDRLDDWISLSLGGVGGGSVESTSTERRTSKQQFKSREDRMESLADTASLLLSMNGDRVNKKTFGSGSPDAIFSHPRQPRSVRKRTYLSIDTDSD